GGGRRGRPRTRGDPVDREARSLEPRRQRGGDRVVVLDDQHPHGSTLARRGPRSALGRRALPNLCLALASPWRSPSYGRITPHKETPHATTPSPGRGRDGRGE